MLWRGTECAGRNCLSQPILVALSINLMRQSIDIDNSGSRNVYSALRQSNRSGRRLVL